MQNQSIGKVHNWTQVKRGISFEADDFSGTVTFHTKKTAHIRIHHIRCAPKHHSYAVCSDPHEDEVDVKSEGNTIIVSTSEARLRINLAPFRVQFEDQIGKVLSKDDDAFGTSIIGTELSTYRTLQKDERFIGLGEKVGPVDRRGHAYTNWNTDKFAYSIEEDPLYLSAPFFIGIHSQGMYGLFLDNNHKSRFNFGASTERFSWFSSQNGAMDYYLIAGDSIPEIISEYTELTGRIPMPPKWSLGYQQCRYSYYPDSEINTLAQTFRDKNIPADVLYLDIHYMEEYKAFTFDKERFPEPLKMNQDLRERGFRTVAIVDPGIKVQPGYGTYDRGIENDVFAKLPDGERYQGEVWPSWSHFPDFTSSKTRKWWGDELKFYHEKGVSGIWNDMNEPAAWGQSLPELIGFDNEGSPTSHAEVRNVYGMQMARATQEGMQKHLKEERPFILTRAGFSGVQRHSAVWTGDNVSSDDHLLLSCRMLCSLGLTGIPYAGNDIGGFASEASPELFARWISVGVFQPMCRAHTQVNTRDAEPWSFGEEVEQIARNYINLRYRLMPYIYTSFKQASNSGMPLMRSMAIAHPYDSLVFDARFENQYYFGDHFLICPVRSTQLHAEVYLPEGEWFDLYTDKRYRGGQSYLVESPVYKLPVFVKSGAVIPWMSQTQHAEDKHDGILKLHVYGDGSSENSIYEDDGISFDFQNNVFLERAIKKSKSELIISEAIGEFSSAFSQVEFVLHGGTETESLNVNGTSVELKNSEWRSIEAISGIDTFYADKGAELFCNVQSCIVDYTKKSIKVNLQ